MANKLRVMMANFSPGWGGGERWFLTVGEGLIKRGHQVTWWVKPESVLAEKMELKDMPHIALDGKASYVLHPGKVRAASKAVKEFAPDIFLTNASHELKFGAWIAKRVGVPHRVVRRGVSYPFSKNILNRWYMKHIATAFLANGNTTYENFAEVFPHIREIPHAIVYNGIDLRPFENLARQPQPGLCVMSARLSPEKGIDRALHAIAHLTKKGVDIHLRILGTGPEKAKLEALATQLQIMDRVTFAGFVEDVHSHLAEASVFMFTPTHGEGTSLALLEAMAAGLPCIAYQAPSLDEVIIHQETGFLIPPEKPELFADALETLVIQPLIAERMGKLGRHRAIEIFDIERVIDEVEMFFQTIV